MRKKLTAIEKFYIDQHRSTKNAEQLALDIDTKGITANIIQKYLDETTPVTHSKPAEEVGPEPPKIIDLFVLKGGAAIMTETASSVTDPTIQDNKTPNPAPIKSPANKPYISPIQR